MTDHTQGDAPSLPNRSREDFAGSLADHVRHFTTDDPMEASVRDTVAKVAEDVARGAVRPGDEAAEIIPEPSPAAGAPEDEVWETLPPGTTRCLSKDGHLCTVAGGLWTDHETGTQYGHGFFVNSMGPFRAAPQGA